MSRYDLGMQELASLLADEPPYRARQLHQVLYRQLGEPTEATPFPRDLRRALAAREELATALTVSHEAIADRGQTRKWLFRLHDGHLIETVLMHYPRHSTVCVSSQAGCAMGCTFCATGDLGFGRHLDVGEIVEQVVRAARSARSDGRRLDHVVLMGMGEPLANTARVFPAVARLIDDLDLGARHVTVSTVGIVPGIDALATFPYQVNLAVSLHAARDELRRELVPMARRYPLEELGGAIARYRATTNRRVSLEWALIDGVNDQTRDAEELSAYALAHAAHVNLIPLNPTEGGMARGLRGSPRSRVLAFRQWLLAEGVNATIRQTRGQEIDAACGQLAGSAARADRSHHA